MFYILGMMRHVVCNNPALRELEQLKKKKFKKQLIEDI